VSLLCLSREDISSAAKRRRPVTAKSALDAWFSGNFEHCLELCDSVEPTDPDTVLQLAQLKARAHSRLGLWQDAVAILAAAFQHGGSTDEALTTRMLTGAAYVRGGQLGHGLDILTAAQHDAGSAHPTVRSEIALNRALAYFGLRDLTTAEAALSLVSPNSDIVFARALEYRGWIASARADYALAVEYFLASLDCLDTCRHYDRFLEGNALQALAHLALERLEPETWVTVAKRRETIDWSASGLARPHFWVVINAATYAFEVAGTPLDALSEGRLAEKIAPTPAARVEALCRRAATVGHSDERLARRDHTEEAYELYLALDPKSLQGDDRLVSLILAKQLALSGRVAQAKKLHAIYREHSQTSPLLAVTGDPRQRAYEKLVEGEIAEADGQKAPARRAYLDALAGYRKIGYTRRAVHAALHLGWLLNEADLFAYADEVTRHLPQRSWLRQQVQRAPTDQIIKSLRPAQRDVLHLLCVGKSIEEVAENRARSIKTIEATMTEIYKAFNVRSRVELLHELLRRGILKPASDRAEGYSLE
jgi:DNA-binding CsgD family transcriptional regulator